MWRRRLRSGALILCGALVLALAVSVAFGSRPERTAELLAFGGFGLALLAGGLMTLPRDRPVRGAVVRGSVRVDGVTVPALIVSYSRGRQWLAVFALAAFIAMGAGLILHGAVAIGILVIAGFGLVAVLGIRNLLIGSRAALTEHGLHVRDAGAEVWSPWDEVAAARVTQLSGPVPIGGGWIRMQLVRVLAIDTTAPPRSAGPRWARALARTPAAPEQGDINIPVDLLPVEADAFASVIERLANDPEARRSVAEGLPGLRPATA